MSVLQTLGLGGCRAAPVALLLTTGECMLKSIPHRDLLHGRLEQLRCRNSLALEIAWSHREHWQQQRKDGKQNDKCPRSVSHATDWRLSDYGEHNVLPRTASYEVALTVGRKMHNACRATTYRPPFKGAFIVKKKGPLLLRQ